MSNNSPASDLKLNAKDLRVIEKALDILIKNDPFAKKSQNAAAYMRKANNTVKKYYGNKYEAAIAILEMSLSSGNSISTELNANKACTGGCRGACKISCVTYCKGTCKGGCKNGVIFF